MDLLYLAIFLAIFFFSFYLLYHYLHPPKTKSTATPAPNAKFGFKSYPLVGGLPDLLANNHRLWDWIADALSPLPTNTAIQQLIGRRCIVFTANPSNIEHVLRTNFLNYPKGNLTTTLKDFLGEGIFNVDGDLWKLQRKTASYEFNKRSLRSFVLDGVRSEIHTRLVPLLKHSAKRGQVLDLQDALERFAFDNVCKVAFNVDPHCLGSSVDSGAGKKFDFMQAFEAATTASTDRFMCGSDFIWIVKKLLNLGSEKRLKEAIKIIHEYADKIVCERLKEHSESHEDLLSRFIKCGEASPKLLRDIVISIILAGRDTTSSGLSWFFWLLSLHPNVVENIRSEVKAIRIRNGKHLGDVFDLDELREMNYLHAALSESLRLYPPVPSDPKTCLEDDILPDGTEIKKGWCVCYLAYAMGRMENIWGKDCRMFRPERWLENGVCKQENQFRYPVFHAGPRICLGKEMAYIQMKSIVACVIEHFKLDVIGKERTPEYTLSLTLRMKHGLPVRVKERILNIDI
ncbi:hypothetical protein Ancab_031191 [Ancistrocladus abbreviatus]